MPVRDRGGIAGSTRDRPATCRYYPVGMVFLQKQDVPDKGGVLLHGQGGPLQRIAESRGGRSPSGGPNRGSISTMSGTGGGWRSSSGKNRWVQRQEGLSRRPSSSSSWSARTSRVSGASSSRKPVPVGLRRPGRKDREDEE